jgi:hypothetical protein
MEMEKKLSNLHRVIDEGTFNKLQVDGAQRIGGYLTLLFLRRNKCHGDWEVGLCG